MQVIQIWFSPIRGVQLGEDSYQKKPLFGKRIQITPFHSTQPDNIRSIHPVVSPNLRT